ncbi:hypothetical protein TNCV_4081041 [Trichonephila clavipes]|nr:hypothetical protein TNCV_4081041 [Trichonephila clavipes]
MIVEIHEIPEECQLDKNQRRVTAESSLPFGSAGNLMTHPAVYESNDPHRRGNVLALPCRRNSTVHSKSRSLASTAEEEASCLEDSCPAVKTRSLPGRLKTRALP